VEVGGEPPKLSLRSRDPKGAIAAGLGFEFLCDWECFDGDTGKDSAREIREYFIPDFSNWKDHDSYQTAFQRLVTDLKAKASE
jgi:hypothetical protein